MQIPENFTTHLKRFDHIEDWDEKLDGPRPSAQLQSKQYLNGLEFYQDKLGDVKISEVWKMADDKKKASARRSRYSATASWKDKGTYEFWSAIRDFAVWLGDYANGEVQLRHLTINEAMKRIDK